MAGTLLHIYYFFCPHHNPVKWEAIVCFLQVRWTLRDEYTQSHRIRKWCNCMSTHRSIFVTKPLYRVIWFWNWSPHWSIWHDWQINFISNASWDWFLVVFWGPVLRKFLRMPLDSYERVSYSTSNVCHGHEKGVVAVYMLCICPSWPKVSISCSWGGHITGVSFSGVRTVPK